MATGKSTTNPIDVIVGANIRRGRLESGMTQHQLGRRIGVTAQQVQKYETGKNRVCASRLWEIARTQSTTIESYFESDKTEINSRQKCLINSQIYELLNIYASLSSLKRSSILALAKSLAMEKELS